MVIRDIEREDIEFISKTLGCLPVAHIDHMKPEKLGSAELVEEVEVGMMHKDGTFGENCSVASLATHHKSQVDEITQFVSTDSAS